MPNYRPVQKNESTAGAASSTPPNRDFSTVSSSRLSSSDSTEKTFVDYNFKLFSLYGIPICIHYCLPLFVLLDLIFLLPVIVRHPGNMGYWVALVLLYNVVLWVTVLIHELGHCLAGWMVGGSSSKVILWPLGGLAFTEPPSGVSVQRRRRAQTMIALGGPVTHIPIGIFWMLLLINESSQGWSAKVMRRSHVWEEVIFTPIQDWFWYDVFLLGFGMNLWLLVLNLMLPAYPLDGSKVFINVLRLIGDFEDKTLAWIYVGTNGIMGVAFILCAFTILESVSVLIFGGFWALFQCHNMVKLIDDDHEDRHPLLVD